MMSAAKSPMWRFAELPRRLALACALATLAALAACATPVGTELTAFHEWPAEATRSYRFAATSEQLESLEHRSYRQLLRGELARAGFSETSQAPRFELRFGTSVEPRQTRRVEYSQPYYVQPWFWLGSWGHHGGVSISAPWPGHGGQVIDRELSWYEYRFSVEFHDLAAGGRKVYEASAVAAGSSPTIAAAMPYLARAVFTDFPGRSGVPRRVDIARDAVGSPEVRETPGMPATR
jgi:hypothetical protein